MKKNILILTIYDLLGLLFIGSMIYAALKKDIVVYHDFNLRVNDTIKYDPYNLARGIEIVNIGKETDGFSFIDKLGNAITNKKLWDNFEKYGKTCVWGTDNTQAAYCDSSITEHTPKIAINNLRTTIGFHYSNEEHIPKFVKIAKSRLIWSAVFIALVLILIRRFLQLTLKGDVFSKKGTNVFKYLFILSVSWVVFVYTSYELTVRSMMREAEPPMIYGSNGRAIDRQFTKSFDFNDLYYYVVLMVVTFFLYLAFKYGQKVKSEHDLTV